MPATLTTIGLLLAATILEASGDAVIRIALGQSALVARALLFAAGAALLFSYGLLLNLAPIEFSRVIGVYIATLFVVWQVIGFLAFRTVPTWPILAGGSLIVTGGVVVSLWRSG